LLLGARWALVRALGVVGASAIDKIEWRIRPRQRGSIVD
jgi:hypothetical protein